MGDGRKLGVVFRREFGERVRSRWFLVVTLVGPLFFAALTVLPAWLASRERGSPRAADVTVVDATGTDLGARIARALADPGAALAVDPAAGASAPAVVRTDAAGLAAAEREATALVVRREREGYLVVDSQTLAGARARYAGRNASSLADVERLRDVVRREVLASRLAREGLDPQRAASIANARLTLSAERLTDEGRGGSGVGGAILATIVAFLLYMMILLYGQNVLRSVLEEKTTRVAEVIVASVRPDVLLGGKVLGVGAIGVVQMVVWLAGAFAIGKYVAPRLLGPSAAGPLSALSLPAVGAGFVAACVAFFVVGYLLYSAMFAAAGSMVNSDQEAQQAALPVMLPMIASALLIQVTIANPESPVARFGAWFPLTAPVLMPMRMALTSVSAGEVAAVLLGVTLACLAVTWVAARIYRVGLLMYGKRPSLAELGRWVRQAG